MRVLRSAVVMLLVFATAGAPPKRVLPGVAHFWYFGRDCKDNSRSISVLAHALPNGPTAASEMSVASSRSSLALPSGVYFLRLETQTCVAEFKVAVFSGVSRLLPVMLRPIQHGNSEDEGGAADVYLVPSDALMIELPVDGMSVVVTSFNGKPLVVSVQSRVAFVDYVPAGIVSISVRGANFEESRQIHSSAQYRLHVVAF